MAGRRGGKGGGRTRPTRDGASANAFMMISNANSSAFSYRGSTGANTANSSGPGVSLPYWVKLVRQGATFSGYISPDGSTWTQVGSTATISMPQTVLIGLTASSQNQTPATASFDNVSITSDPDIVLSVLQLYNSTTSVDTLTLTIRL